jgi:CcmD family protein
VARPLGFPEKIACLKSSRAKNFISKKSRFAYFCFGNTTIVRPKPNKIEFNMIRNRVLLVLILALASIIDARAQSADADFLESMGKMYVVLAVVLAIFLGIVVFLIYLDRKLTKLENQIKEE